MLASGKKMLIWDLGMHQIERLFNNQIYLRN